MVLRVTARLRSAAQEWLHRGDPGAVARLRSAAQAWLHRDDPGAVARLLARGTAAVARRRAAVARARAEVPTIVVGGLSVGGAGKTPVVALLARRIGARRRVAVVGHGYGGRIRGAAVVEAPDAVWFGDEAAALRRALPAAVRVVAGARRAAYALAAGWAEVVIVDDGFQDPALPRTLDVVVVDATAGRLPFPAGPLREGLSALGRADVVWLHKVDEPGAQALPVAADVQSRVVIGAVRLADGRRVGAEWLAGRALRPICGIGRPGSFLHTLAAAGAVVEPGVMRADHHRFTAAELARLPVGAPWVTTSKDAERLPAGFAAVVEVEPSIVRGEAALAALVERFGGAP
ncbi:MAG: tetraacyldisaccharide 4'-kinase [Myxococcales bacterium]|nr:tetraacyldisaccharide 4'-kinase [Myxococcales bacterium]